IGFGYRALRKRQSLALTGVLMGLTFLAHFIYGYIAALSLCVLAILPDADGTRVARIPRTVWIGCIAGVVAAFELVPLIMDGPIINPSRWEYAWKWDSFGAGQVLKLLFTGELLDHGRFPVLTLLFFGGAIVCARSKTPARTFLIASGAFWILLLFGRP